MLDIFPLTIPLHNYLLHNILPQVGVFGPSVEFRVFSVKGVKVTRRGNRRPRSVQN
jgi:hypothetical protein